MPRRPPGLPEFETPPLNELVMSVQFEPLMEGASPLVILWQELYRNRYPHLEEHAPLDPRVETFGHRPGLDQSFRLEISGLQSIRLWMLSPDRTEVIQLQNDRFVRNWRQQHPGTPYPRYESLRKRFKEDFQKLLDRLRRDNATISINQCEIGYINLLGETPEGSDSLHRRLGQLLSGCYDQLSVAGCDLETVAMNNTWVDRGERRPPSRLRAQVVPAYTHQGKHAFQFTLTYRGAPRDSSMESVMEFMDRGRTRIVNAFAEMTTEEMHRVWGRKG